MRYALISDIHSNLEALTAVLQEIENERTDKIICLGDIVGYNANPNECIEVLQEYRVQCIAGNHDRVAVKHKKPTNFGERGRRAIYWTQKQLLSDNIRLLEKLPLIEMIDQQFLVVHASLHPEPNEEVYLLTETEIMKSFDELIKHNPKVNICFFGHTHLSGAYEYFNGVLSMTKNEIIKLKPDAFYLLNPGSVGKSHNYKDTRATFLTFDTDEKVIKFYRVNYDHAKCQKKIEQNGLLHGKNLSRRVLSNAIKSIGVGKNSIKQIF